MSEIHPPNCCCPLHRADSVAPLAPPARSLAEAEIVAAAKEWGAARSVAIGLGNLGSIPPAAMDRLAAAECTLRDKVAALARIDTPEGGER